jgi:hypothetical protein
MSDDSFVITVIGTIATTVLSLVILRFLKFYEKKQDRKADEIKIEAIKSAEKVKDNVSDMARELAEKAEERNRLHAEATAKIAKDLKIQSQIADENIAKTLNETTTKTASDLRATISKLADDIQSQTGQQNKEILDKISGVDKRLSDMITSLQYKSEMTNGNVASIRKDLLEIQEDVDTIYNRVNVTGIILDKKNPVTPPPGPEVIRKRDKRRKARRKQIIETAKAQHTNIKNLDNLKDGGS